MTELYHISKRREFNPQSTPQLYAYGFNASGRPDGVWIARGADWLRFEPRVKTASEYMHAVSIDDARILHVQTLEDIVTLYVHGGYWINYEYFDLNVRDVVDGKLHVYAGRLRLSWPRLRKRPGQTLRDILSQNGVIADSADIARKQCPFYTGMCDDELARWRFPDWGVVSTKYAGVWFDFDTASACMRYMWYQSLGASSGCVWDVSAITDVRFEREITH